MLIFHHVFVKCASFPQSNPVIHVIHKDKKKKKEKRERERERERGEVCVLCIPSLLAAAPSMRFSVSYHIGRKTDRQTERERERERERRRERKIF